MKMNWNAVIDSLLASASAMDQEAGRPTARGELLTALATAFEAGVDPGDTR